ncbi:Leucine-rich repeat-containing protein 27 [Anthophora retusa]
MSDLAKDLLTRYYGFDAELSGKRFLSIHQSVEDAKNEEEKQITELTTCLTTDEENLSNEDSQKDIDDSLKLSAVSESYRQPSRVLDDLEDTYNPDETFDVFNIDLGPNILCDIFEHATSTPRDKPLNDVSIDCTKIVENPEIEINDANDTTENDGNRAFIEDTFPDNISDVSSTTLKNSPKSSKSSVHLTSVVPRKQPLCNDTFADFSNTDIKQFPYNVLNYFPHLRMLYLSNNSLTELPDEVFTYLRYLEWLDVRNNKLSSLPVTIKWHGFLETILLQGNNVEHLPLELCTLPNLRTLQVTQNPLVTPPKDIVASGCSAILEFLRFHWNNVHPEEQIQSKENKIEPKLSTILCYQSPRKDKRRITQLKDVIRNKNASIRERRKSYKPSNRCKNKGANNLMEHRMLWFSKLKELFSKENAILQKIKDENVLKDWRRDKRSYSKAMEKAMKRNEDDIPFGFDFEDYNLIFKQNSKPRNLGSRRKGKEKFTPPADINGKINELLESLNKLEINTTNQVTPRTKQSLYKDEIEKILQYQSEIQHLRRYNDVAMVPLKN